MDKLMTTAEVAEYFRVTPSTITTRFVKKGLRYFPVSTKEYRFNFEDVKKFEEEMKNQTRTNIDMTNKLEMLSNIRKVNCIRKVY